MMRALLTACGQSEDIKSLTNPILSSRKELNPVAMIASAVRVGKQGVSLRGGLIPVVRRLTRPFGH